MKQHFTNASFTYIENSAEDFLIQAFKSLSLNFSIYFEELFLFHVFGRIEYNITRLVCAKKTILLENGIATSDPPKGRLKQSPQIRISEAWLPLSPILGSPYYLNRDLVRTPSTNSYTEATKQLLSAHNPNDEFDVFVIGTSLHRLGIISLADEINAYSSFIKKMKHDNRIKKILWKPHPRMQSQEIGSFVDNEKITVVEDDMPIELLFSLKKSSQAFSTSIASSALLTGWLYFGIKPNLLAAKLSRLEKFPHITKIRQIIQRLAD